MQLNISKTNLRLFRKMKSFNFGLLFLVAILVISTLPFSQAFRRNFPKVKTSVYLSPKIELGPGHVSNKVYWNVDFPRGHIALKSFYAELIDEVGNPVPLHDTYLHHWIIAKGFVREGLEKNVTLPLDTKDALIARNAGVCQGDILSQLFGSGTETRHTSTYVPDPYGIEVGNPKDTPKGYVQSWILNVHAIDSRGVEDTEGCIECRCDLYNVTKYENGKPLPPNYKGGMPCCHDDAQCRLKQGFQGIKRTIYLRYTVKYVEMDRSVLPVDVYIFDVSDMWKRTSNSTGKMSEHKCQIEYDVAPCHAKSIDECIENKRISLDMPFSGYLVYGVGHLHGGGTSFTLYRENGKRLFTSWPIYGTGEEAGNEAGYVVGMSTYTPKPGSVMISKGETLILESNYSNIRPHYGVMGHALILISKHLPK